MYDIIMAVKSKLNIGIKSYAKKIMFTQNIIVTNFTYLSRSFVGFHISEQSKITEI
jgi:hypothetical protein